MGKDSKPRRHHYIPQFYLRGFGADKGLVRVVDLRAKKHFACSADNIAHVRDFYAFEKPDGVRGVVIAEAQGARTRKRESRAS
jgi:uncharacterized protein DUF4238